jgi:type I restriction enzyme M protein
LGGHKSIVLFIERYDSIKQILLDYSIILGGIMLGAIIGDIVGSRFEWDNIKSKNFEFLSDDCYFTDDSVVSLAVARAILDCNGNYENLSNVAVFCMQNIGRPYRYCGYGDMFEQWIYSDNPKPYYSFGNGAAVK